MTWLEDLRLELNQFQCDGVNPSQKEVKEASEPKKEDAPQ